MCTCRWNIFCTFIVCYYFLSTLQILSVLPNVYWLEPLHTTLLYNSDLLSPLATNRCGHPYQLGLVVSSYCIVLQCIIIYIVTLPMYRNISYRKVLANTQPYYSSFKIYTLGHYPIKSNLRQVIELQKMQYHRAHICYFNTSLIYLLTFYTDI